MMNNVERTMHTQEDRLQRLRAGLEEHAAQAAPPETKDAPMVQDELAVQAEAVDRMHKLLEVLQGRLGWVLEEAEQPKAAALPAVGEPVTSGRRSRLVQELRAGSARLLSFERRLKDLVARVKM